MTIGKRKGAAAKGAGDSGSHTGSKFGGSLSKADHWYINQAFGMSFDPGSAGPAYAGHQATGGTIGDYTDPGGTAYRTHIFNGSGTFQITELSGTYPAAVEYVLVAVSYTHLRAHET